MNYFNMIFGIFDFLIIGMLLIGDFYFWKSKKILKINWVTLIIWFLLFFVALPYLSSKYEFWVANKKYDGEADSFNFWYIYFKWPIYWIIGLLEIMIIVNSNRRVKKGH